MDGTIQSVDLVEHLTANPQLGRLLRDGDDSAVAAVFDRCVLNNHLMFPVTPDLRCFRRHFGMFHEMAYGMVGQAPSPVFLQALDQPEPPGRYLAMGGNDNYFHWCLDHLPRLVFGMLTDGAERRVIMDGPPNAWQAASLRLFMIGLKLDRLDLHVSRSDWSCYPDCLVPLPLRSQAVAIWNVVLNHARDVLPAPSGVKRLFVLRRNTSKRFAVNQDEVAEALKPLGFLAVDPGSLTFEEQVALFSDAELIVGCHGAALTNILFAPAGATLIELRGRVLQPFFGNLAVQRGMRHRDLACIEQPDSHPDIIERDYVVPLDALRELLAGVGVR
ncbi:glycosyltransferase family 61 protein [Azospirillum himalayense]|uniref:Glycosyltransferase family 61 protein n=1 Tax=Azospirillum himalayense TaxID=654847 RepID=A0ABW0G7L6_9PROT